jgi:hypothetical protein
MMTNNRSIFRQQALEHYQHIQVPKTVPRFTSPLTIFWYWVLFFCFVSIVFFVWALNVPVYQQGTAVIRNLAASELKSYGLSVSGNSKQTIAIMFLPAQSATALHNGSSVSILITSTLQPVAGKVERIDPATLTSDEARQRYQLDASVLSGIPQTSVVAFISFDSTAVNEKYAGKSALAIYQSGTISVLPLLLQSVMGGSKK